MDRKALLAELSISIKERLYHLQGMTACWEYGTDNSIAHRSHREDYEAEVARASTLRNQLHAS